MNKRLGVLLQHATKGRAESTLPELFEVLEVNSGGMLENIFLVRKQLVDLGLKLVPDVDHGDIQTTRLVEFIEAPKITEAEVMDDLTRREAEDLEMKSSLLYDHQRAKNAPGAPPAQLKSEGVMESTLRTIAGFLTSGGGILYIGVDDEGVVLGIDCDFPCITAIRERQNADNWELHLRSCVESRFIDGKSINDYIACKVVCVQGKQVARINVASRKRLSFVSIKGTTRLFRRQGNRTVEVPIESVEEFIEFRKGARV